MVVTKDKLASLLVFAFVVTIAMTFLSSWGLPGFGVFLAILVSLMGVMLIWFAEPLAESGCFSRGVALASPPVLIEAFGWIFLIGYPLLLLWLIRTSPAWAQ